MFEYSGLLVIADVCSNLINRRCNHLSSNCSLPNHPVQLVLISAEAELVWLRVMSVGRIASWASCAFFDLFLNFLILGFRAWAPNCFLMWPRMASIASSASIMESVRMYVIRPVGVPPLMAIPSYNDCAVRIVLDEEAEFFDGFLLKGRGNKYLVVLFVFFL